MSDSDTEPRNSAISASAPRVRGRPFQKGNPGRRPGARGKAAVLAEKLAAKDITEIVNVLVTAAKLGDVQSATLLLARLWPPPKGRLVAFDLRPIQTAADAEAAIGAVLAAVAAAKLTVDEGDKLAGIIERKAGVSHMAEIERRLEALEKPTLTYQRIS